MVGFAKAFDQTDMAQRTRGTLAQPYEAPNPKCEEALIQYKYALSGELPPLDCSSRDGNATSGNFLACGVMLACGVLLNFVLPCWLAFSLPCDACIH